MPGRTAEALAALDRLADRTRSRVVFWSEPTPGAIETIAALERAGVAVVIVTNSDGHAEENLRDSGFAGVPVIDSEVVGVAKPDVRIFEIALELAGAEPGATVHVGDALSMTSPAPSPPASPRSTSTRSVCRAPDHRHIRSLPGLRRHVAPG